MAFIFIKNVVKRFVLYLWPNIALDFPWPIVDILHSGYQLLIAPVISFLAGVYLFGGNHLHIILARYLPELWLEDAADYLGSLKDTLTNVDYTFWQRYRTILGHLFGFILKPIIYVMVFPWGAMIIRASDGPMVPALLLFAIFVTMLLYSAFYKSRHSTNHPHAPVMYPGMWLLLLVTYTTISLFKLDGFAQEFKKTCWRYGFNFQCLQDYADATSQTTITLVYATGLAFWIAGHRISLTAGIKMALMALVTLFAIVLAYFTEKCPTYFWIIGPICYVIGLLDDRGVLYFARPVYLWPATLHPRLARLLHRHGVIDTSDVPLPPSRAGSTYSSPSTSPRSAGGFGSAGSPNVFNGPRVGPRRPGNLPCPTSSSSSRLRPSNSGIPPSPVALGDQSNVAAPGSPTTAVESKN